MSFFESTLLNFTQTLTKLDLPTLRKGSIEERTQRNKIKNLTLAGSLTQVPGFSSAVAVTAMPRVPVAGPEFLSL